MSRRHGLIGASKPYLYKEEDAEFYYRQTSGGVIMNNSPLVGSIKAIKGQTIAWNQLVKLKNNLTTNGLTFTVEGDVITINGTSISGMNILLSNVISNYSNIVGLKAYKCFYIISGSTDGSIEIWTASKVYNYPLNGVVVNIPSSTSHYITVAESQVFNNLKIKLDCICLTLIYGAGNEPTTPEQFEADYQKWFGKPLTYEPYDEGSLRNVQMKGIKSVGFNQWDEEWENGNYNTRTGEILATPYKIRNKNLIPVIYGKTYYIKSPVGLNIFKYDGSKNFVVYRPHNPGETFVADCAFINFSTFGESYTTYNNDICINISDTNKNGTYAPYKSDTRNFDVTSITGKLNGEGESVVIFPDGMKGVNDVKDEIYVEDGVTKAVKRVGRVDLGSLNLEKSGAGTYAFYSTSLRNLMKAYTENIKSAIFVRGSVSSSNTNKMSVDGNSTIYLALQPYTDKTTFVSAMSGVYLDYELAEPQMYVLDTPLPIAYNCEASGTEQILPENSGTPTSIAPIMDIKYNIGQINN